MFNLGTTSLFIRSKVKEPLYTWVCAGHSSIHLGECRAQHMYTWVCAEHSSIHLAVCRAQLYTHGVQDTAYIHLVCMACTALYTWVCVGHSSIHLMCMAQLYTPGCLQGTALYSWVCAYPFLCGSCVHDAFCRTFACYVCFSVTLVYVMFFCFFLLSFFCSTSARNVFP